MRCQRTLKLCTMLMITGIPQSAGQKSFESGRSRKNDVQIRFPENVGSGATISLGAIFFCFLSFLTKARRD